MASISISHASPLLPSKTFTRQTWNNSFPTKPKWRPKQLKRQKCLAAGGFPTPMDEESGSRNSGKQENQNWDPSQCEALLKGGQQVISVLAEMAKLRRTLLKVIKETVLSHLTKKCPPHVQMLGLLCRTPGKES
ncbi:hypothetical protein ACH5RR_010365 [Cinchona calisaya]|uniref:Uncharacterized protein n=1 Tax=Cinchona calisaya TaxID=153742 RepID=A0ABD3AIR1_9GENT